MRLLKSEHKNFTEKILAAGYKSEDFVFTKKTGWLYIKSINSTNAFAYHRKDTTELNDNMQWTKTTIYLSKVDKTKMTYQSFSEVIIAFSSWLKQL